MWRVTREPVVRGRPERTLPRRDVSRAEWPAKAPAALVEAERAKAEEWRARCALMRTKLGAFNA